MTTLDKYISDLEKLADLESFLIDLFIKYEGSIVGMIKNRLYQTGLDGKYNLIGHYTEASAAEKRNKNQRASFITLRDTGDFYAGMYAEYDGGELVTDSTDSKRNMLVAEYGEDILALTEQEQEAIIDHYIDIGLQKHIDKLGQQISGGPDGSGELFSTT